MIKGSIQQEIIAIVNIYVPNIEAMQYIKLILTDTKGKIDSNIVIVRGFNTMLTSMNSPSRQKIHKVTLALKIHYTRGN